jgi:ketosteroid isomerase-like protein
MLSDRAEIADLMAEYCHGLDKREVDMFLAIWHPDAVWDLGEAGVFSGLEEIRKHAEVSWGAFPETHHLTVNALIKVDGDHATALADAHLTAFDQSGREHHVIASYDDVFARRDGRFRFANRKAIARKRPDPTTD